MTVKNLFVMGQWVQITVLLLLLSLPKKKASSSDDESFFSSLLLEESFNEAQCDQMQMEMAELDSATLMDSVPKLTGKWVSQDCEVRPGPDFLLRSYSFSKNNTFRLLQHFYDDESCILPLFTVVAKGRLSFKEPSWVTPSAMRTEFTLTTVFIIPHTTEIAENIYRSVKEGCPDWVGKPWKPHHEYTVYNSKKSDTDHEIYKTRRKYRNSRKKMSKNIDCLHGAGLEFNELRLMRTQWRPVDDGKRNKELLLGDIHSRKESQFSYKPTAFQVPLLKTDQAHHCVNCRLIAKGSERAPPHLLSKPQLPPLPHGQWISQRCEIRPMGMFLTRKLSFDSRDRTWIGEYKFYSDPVCTEAVFSILASGKYIFESVQSKKRIFQRFKTGTNFDFEIEKAFLTLYDFTLKDTFNGETNCGIGSWVIGVPKDLTPTNGCSILGMFLPSKEYDLIKLEIDNKGTPLLLMGLPDSENKKRSIMERPTSYQAPLAQCSIFPQEDIHDKHREPISYARVAPQSSASNRAKLTSIFVILLLLLKNATVVFV